MFDKNLEFIDNLALKRRLAKISPIESRIGISYCVTPSNDYVLLKNDLPADDLTNPREAIKQMLKNTIQNEMRENDKIITFGIGLGYLLDEVFNTYKSKIYIYEPDLNLLHFVLNNVDISEHLSSGRVYITNDLDELIAKISASYITKDRIEIVYLQNYAVIKNTEMLLLTQKVFDACKSKIVDVNTITKFSKKWLSNILDNISAINNNKGYLLSDLNQKFIGQTALIAAAGPSLKDNISKIKENRNKFVIFAVNKVAPFLFQNDIVPDFIVCLDAKNMNRTLSSIEPYLQQTNCIMDIRSDSTLMNKNFKKVFINFSDTDFLSKKISKYNKQIQFCEAGGSASTLALVSAIKMGFSKIVLSGMDLAFKENIIYSYGETMQRISQNEILVDNVKKTITQVRSVNGGMVYTREDYQAFIHHLTTILKEQEYNEVYNTSTFGAQIEGTKKISFDELSIDTNANTSPVDTIEPFKIELKDFMQDEFCNINSIISMLSKGAFSPALVSSIVKSVLVYQYMQADILSVLQKNFDPALADKFIEKTKLAVRSVVEQLQKNKLI